MHGTELSKGKYQGEVNEAQVETLRVEQTITMRSEPVTPNNKVCSCVKSVHLVFYIQDNNINEVIDRVILHKERRLVKMQTSLWLGEHRCHSYNDERVVNG